ncbi:MAG: hypothetical protein AAGD32_05270 [Planctomycetota bacterium]
MKTIALILTLLAGLGVAASDHVTRVDTDAGPHVLPALTNVDALADAGFAIDIDVLAGHVTSRYPRQIAGPSADAGVALANRHLLPGLLILDYERDDAEVNAALIRQLRQIHPYEPIAAYDYPGGPLAHHEEIQRLKPALERPRNKATAQRWTRINQDRIAAKRDPHELLRDMVDYAAPVGYSYYWHKLTPEQFGAANAAKLAEAAEWGLPIVYFVSPYQRGISKGDRRVRIPDAYQAAQLRALRDVGGQPIVWLQANSDAEAVEAAGDMIRLWRQVCMEDQGR